MFKLDTLVYEKRTGKWKAFYHVDAFDFWSDDATYKKMNYEEISEFLYARYNYKLPKRIGQLCFQYEEDGFEFYTV